MSLTFGFYNSENGDRRYNASQMSGLFDGVIKDGIFEAIGDKLMVSAGSGMTVNVGTGRAWFNQTWTYNDSILPLEISSSEVFFNRIDTVAIDIDKLGRVNDIIVIKGTPAEVPVAPTLVNDPDVQHYQYPLCDIYVKAGVTEITQVDITNRVGIGSPFVTGAVQSVSVDGLVAQWQASFNAWMDSLRDILGDDAAAELAARVLELDDGKLSRSSVDGKNTMLSFMDMGGHKILNVGTPREGLDGILDGVNRHYLEKVISANRTTVTCLWKNASQTSEFAAQHIHPAEVYLPITYKEAYDALYIRCRHSTNYGYEQTILLTGGLGGICTFPSTDLWGCPVTHTWSRPFIWGENTIQVGDCQSEYDETLSMGASVFKDNSYVIPIAVYGIKWGLFTDSVAT